MNKITHPLKRGTQGPPVVDRHNALQIMLDRLAILDMDDVVSKDLAIALRKGRSNAIIRAAHR